MNNFNAVKYNYRDHGSDKHYGRRLFIVSECSGADQYRVKESILVRDKDGLLGFVGDGPVWAMNYMTNTGAYSFNPIDEADIVWSPFHHAFILRCEQEHFEFPVIVGQYYYLKDGVKSTGMFEGDHPYTKLPPLLMTEWDGRETVEGAKAAIEKLENWSKQNAGHSYSIHSSGGRKTVHLGLDGQLGKGEGRSMVAAVSEAFRGDRD